MTARKLLLTIVVLIVSPVGVAGNQTASSADEAQSRAAELERHERDFRIQVYRTFRDNRAEFDLRRAAWKRVQSAWREHGVDAADEAKYVDWLAAAVEASSSERVGPLPDDPQFGAVAPVELAPIVSEPPRPETTGTPPTTSGDSPPHTVLVPEPVVEPPPLVEESTAADAHPTPGAEADDPHPNFPPAENITPADQAANSIARINIAELAAGIAGHNFGVLSVESDLLEAGQPDVEQLETALARLEALSVRRGDLSLYYNLLPAAQRGLLEPLAAPSEATLLLGNHIAELRARLESSPWKTAAGRESSLAELDSLSRRLAELYTHEQFHQGNAP